VKRITVVYDGYCGLCRAAMENIHRRYGAKVIGVDFRTVDLKEIHPELTEQALEASLHVVDENRVYRGAGALVRIGRLHPVWRRMVWLYALPPVRWMADALYDWVASHRIALSRVLGLQAACEDGACTVHHRRK
jgi:predicted DCC family thiol-disulfide oxidoreductase YuxK